jgi:hypothetical protein
MPIKESLIAAKQALSLSKAQSQTDQSRYSSEPLNPQRGQLQRSQNGHTQVELGAARIPVKTPAAEPIKLALAPDRVMASSIRPELKKVVFKVLATLLEIPAAKTSTPDPARPAVLPENLPTQPKSPGFGETPSKQGQIAAEPKPPLRSPQSQNIEKAAIDPMRFPAQSSTPLGKVIPQSSRVAGAPIAALDLDPFIQATSKQTQSTSAPNISTSVREIQTVEKGVQSPMEKVVLDLLRSSVQRPLPLTSPAIQTGSLPRGLVQHVHDLLQRVMLSRLSNPQQGFPDLAQGFEKPDPMFAPPLNTGRATQMETLPASMANARFEVSAITLPAQNPPTALPPSLVMRDMSFLVALFASSIPGWPVEQPKAGGAFKKAMSQYGRGLRELSQDELAQLLARSGASLGLLDVVKKMIRDLDDQIDDDTLDAIVHAMLKARSMVLEGLATLLEWYKGGEDFDEGLGKEEGSH